MNKPPEESDCLHPNGEVLGPLSNVLANERKMVFKMVGSC